MQRTLSERRALRFLGIEDFRHITKDKVVKFASILPRMDPEVAKKALEQFPEYVTLTSSMIDTYKGIIVKMLEANTSDTQAFYDACNKILTSINKQLENENLTLQERKELNDNMINVANMIENKGSENKRFWIEVLGKTGKWMFGIFILVGSGIGIRWLSRNE